MRTARVIVEPRAKQDIRDARDWYASKSPELSDAFRDDLEVTFDRIANAPLGTAVSFGRTRLKPMGRFPYVIGYIYHDHEVHITAVLHGRRDSDLFENREVT